ncbi:MAG: outer membrane beta-barrel protein [Gemmatimonadaceae bacterium]
MKRILVGAALAAAMASPLQAQYGDPITEGQASFYVGPYVGYMWFGDLFEFPSGVEYSAENGAQYGVQAGVSFSPNFSLLGNFGYNKSKFTFETDGQPGVDASGDQGIFFYDANLQFRLPFSMGMESWLAPFAQVGAGAIKYTPDTDDFNSPGKTDIAFNVGIGGDFQFMKTLGMRVMLKDYITSLEWEDADDVTFDDNVESNVAHNLALTIGLNFGF